MRVRNPIRDRSDLTGPLKPTDRRKGQATLIVIHRNTVAPDVDGTAAWYANPPPGNEQYGFRLFPYHFFVDDDRVSQVHSIDTVSPHAGPQGFNGPGIGIALNFDGRKVRPPEAMLEMCIMLMTTLMVATRAVSVTGHSVAKGCPGAMVPIEDMARAARRAANTSPLVAEGLRLTRNW
jgi:hypothetical protein